MCLTHELCLTRFGLISMMRPELDPQWFGANPSTFGVKTLSLHPREAALRSPLQPTASAEQEWGGGYTGVTLLPRTLQ